MKYLSGSLESVASVESCGRPEVLFLFLTFLTTFERWAPLGGLIPGEPESLQNACLKAGQGLDDNVSTGQDRMTAIRGGISVVLVYVLIIVKTKTVNQVNQFFLCLCFLTRNSVRVSIICTYRESVVTL